MWLTSNEVDHSNRILHANMGVLKHIVLPILACAHAFQAFKILTDGKSELPKFYGWPGASTPLSAREEHMMGVILSISLALAVNCFISILFETAHYRGMATLLELVYFGSEFLDAYATGFPYKIKACFAALALIGLVIHSMEPGIFTKDKTKAKTK
jgi:hypothetical protein